MSAASPASTHTVGNAADRLWSIAQLAKLAGVSTRTLRYYQQRGLLQPTAVDAAGVRYYNTATVLRLLRILLLRELGMSVADVGKVLSGDWSDLEALTHLSQQLREQQQHLDRQLAALTQSLNKLKQGEELMAEDILAGFDHTQYREEVEQRWGKQAYADSAAWWRALSVAEKNDFLTLSQQLAEDWQQAFHRGADPASDAAQQLAQRHVEWLTRYYQGHKPSPEHLKGLADMYVADARFAANYETVSGDGGAVFVRDALLIWADQDQ